MSVLHSEIVFTLLFYTAYQAFELDLNTYFNMTWFFSPINSTDTSVGILAGNRTTAVSHAFPTGCNWFVLRIAVPRIIGYVVCFLGPFCHH